MNSMLHSERLEELRAAAPAEVASAPCCANASPARNDRIALRLAADWLCGSLLATNESISNDRIASSTHPTFRDGVTWDSALLWIDDLILRITYAGLPTGGASSAFTATCN